MAASAPQQQQQQQQEEAPLEAPIEAPLVRDMLLEHFCDPTLEVEGKLGRRTKNGFTAGVSEEQFEALEGRLLAGASCLGLPGATAPEPEETLDRFYGEPCAEEAPAPAPSKRRRGRGGAGNNKSSPAVRSSFACDESGRPRDEPFEVMRKVRLQDCHVGRPIDGTLPENVHVDVRVSFSREVPAQHEATGRAIVLFERRKCRRTFEAPLWRIQLTRVGLTQAVASGGGFAGAEAAGEAAGEAPGRPAVAEKREVFEVEVELRMEVVRSRLEAADTATAAVEALHVTREIVAALRILASWAVDVPLNRKRKRLEEFQKVEPALHATLTEPEVDEQVRRFTSEGKDALPQAKHYLYELLKARHASLEESALYHFAGRHVARILYGKKRPGQSAAAQAAEEGAEVGAEEASPEG